MKPRLKSTPAARDLIKAYEPFLASARQAADGDWRVGYAHRATAKQGVSVSEADAGLLLIYDVLQAEKAIDEAIGKELGAPQRDALVSFALGIGLPAFRRSAVVRLIAKGRWSDAADAIEAWNGGGEARHAAERELFLKDLPENEELTPVELVIEFDHPDDELVATDAGDDIKETAEETQTAEDSGEPAADAAEDSFESSSPAQAPGLTAIPARSPLAEKVILRMQAQLSGPVHESAYVEPADSGSESEALESVDEDEEADVVSGMMGYTFTQSMDMEDDREAVDSSSEDLGDRPPLVADAEAASFGDVTGQGSEDLPEEPVHDDAEQDLPQPEDIVPPGSDAPRRENSNGWTNGDSKPAPGRNGGHLGEIILLILGIVLLAGGAWDLSSRLGDTEDSSNLFVGLSALVVGFIFAVGAAIWLIGARRK